MSEYYALFVKDQLVAIFEDLRKCLVWSAEKHSDQGVLIKRVRAVGKSDFSIFDIPVEKIEVSE